MSQISEPLELAKDAQDLLFREARTANTFSDEPVTEEQVRAVHDLVKYGPTAMNSQPLRIVLLRSPQSRERLVRHMSEGNQAKTRTAPLTAILAYDSEFYEKADRFFPDRAQSVRDMFSGNAEARANFAKLNATLQIGYFLVGVRAAGLAAGPMTGFDAAAVDAEFFPEGRYRSLVVMNIGRPGADHPQFPRLPRLEYEDMVTEL
ncbi:malonic semialdehyde reductase [Thermobifida cellulosilytica]|uniref:Malonic semialdehyde reductase n=1 Tax=Thermobifida cellulosilytica TB100 TaxID=665004 RepID=A0A147KG26_THECS|nr:malonic semialdehyde reductase [Thermobifida cellulosilytica]KUP96245.1 malonic semialdehyde reductase [Thermobifida cellulosilytica TB100]